MFHYVIRYTIYNFIRSIFRKRGILNLNFLLIAIALFIYAEDIFQPHIANPIVKVKNEIKHFVQK